jgi:hypothetical protein
MYTYDVLGTLTGYCDANLLLKNALFFNGLLPLWGTATGCFY